MHTCRRLGSLVAVGVLLAGCRSPVQNVQGQKVEPRLCEVPGEVTHSIFLIGDAGAPKLAPDGARELVDPVLLALRDSVAQQVAKLGADRVAVVYLGDNVYWDGLPVEGHKDRRHGERVLEAQMDASAPARAFFMLGNHDWHIEGAEGWDRALAQRRFLERFEPRVTMHPPGGCAGPDRVDFGPYLRFVFIDPIGFSHLADWPVEHKSECSPRSLEEAYRDLASEFDHPDDRHVVLALHHPMLTAGPHGGHFGWKQHLFPLTDFWPWAWLPLPVIGSAYPISRQYGVTGTDAASRPYQRWIRGIYRASRLGVPAIFVGGHEHSLQVHHDVVDTYYLVSGSGSKIDRVVGDTEMDTIMLAQARHGFMRMDAHADGAVELAVSAVNERDGSTDELLRHCLRPGPFEPWRRAPERARP